jgi:hypothetical protein
VIELSEMWKKECAMRLAGKGKDNDKQESSDSDVDIVEDTAHIAKRSTKAARIRG